MYEIKLDPVPVVVALTKENYVILSTVQSALTTLGVCPTCKVPTVRPMITSGSDNVHGDGSQHYTNQALDFRIVWKQIQEEKVLRNLKMKLPPEYRFLREATHLHVERIER